MDIQDKNDGQKDEPDEAIVRRVQQGDIQAFRALVERYEPKITRYANRFLFDSDDAKDPVQETFIKVYVNIKSFDPARRFSPWIYRIAHNEFADAWKKHKRDREAVSFFDLDLLLPHFAHPVAKETADGAVNREEMKKMLDRSLARLDPKYREPLILYYYEEMDYKAIADILHIPVATVGVRLSRGKAMLQKDAEIIK